MGVPIPGDREERLLQAERLVNQLAWQEQKLYELNLGAQQYIEDWIGMSPGGAALGCDPALTETVNLPSGAADVGATVTVKDHATGIVLATGTTGALGMVTLGPGIGLGNRTVDVLAGDSRGCFLSPVHTLNFLCVDLADTITLGPFTAGNIALTVKTCTVAGLAAPGLTVDLHDPTGTHVATVTTDAFGVASFVGVVGPKGNWTAAITGPGVSTTVTISITVCGTNNSTAVVPATVFTYEGHVKACGLAFGTGPCLQPGVTVEVRDAGGTALGSGTTDNAGFYSFTGPDNAVTLAAYSADFNVATLPIAGNADYGWDATIGCTKTMPDLTVINKANHFCYGGVVPPGYTGLAPATVTATIPNDPAIDAGIRGAAYTCNRVGIVGGGMVWESACFANPGNPFFPWAKVSCSVPATSCGENLAGTCTITRYAANTCAGSTGGSAFNATSPAGVIWNPVAYGGSYVSGGVTYSWTVAEP